MFSRVSKPAPSFVETYPTLIWLVLVMNRVFPSRESFSQYSICHRTAVSATIHYCHWLLLGIATVISDYESQLPITFCHYTSLLFSAVIFFISSCNILLLTRVMHWWLSNITCTNMTANSFVTDIYNRMYEEMGSYSCRLESTITYAENSNHLTGPKPW